MKVSLVLLSAILFVCFLAGCGNNHSVVENTPSSLVSDGNTTKTSDLQTSDPVESVAPTTSINAESTDEANLLPNPDSSADQTSKPTATSKPTQTEKPVDNSKTPEDSKPPQTSTPAETSKPVETTKPQETSKPTQPESSEPPKPVFDVNVYVSYAKQYGQSIGLIYESQIGTDSWNAPVNLYATLSEETMNKNIRSGCDRLKKEGFEYFYLYAEKQGDGSYKLYIYYG